jgi:Two component regulator propeller
MRPLLKTMLLAVVCIGSSHFATAQLSPIGNWREHLPYNSALQVAAADPFLYCATPYSLFSVDTRDNSINRLSKINGLSEVGISAIKYNENSQRLLIAYNNSNIDFLYRNDIYNLPDIKRKLINGDKSIYNIFFAGTRAYLSTGIGVIVADEERNEIKDTWYVGNNGAFVKVTGFSADNNFFYAATTEGLKRAITTAPNLADYRNWLLQSGSNNLPPGPCADVVNLQGSILALVNDTLYKWNGTNWTLFYTDTWPMINLNVTENKLLICERRANGASRVVALTPAGTVDRIMQQPGVISFPRQALSFQNQYWVADQFGGLSTFAGATGERILPNAPEGTASGEMLVANNTLWITAGEVNEAWNYQYNRNGIYRFANGEWTNINGFRLPLLDTLLDFITVAVDPVTQTAYAGSYGGGLLSIKSDGSLSVFKQNSLLAPAIGDPTSYRVSGLAFDANNNLWIANYGAPQNLLVKKPDGAWKRFTIPFFHNENALAQILPDDNNQLWMVSPKGNGLFCYGPGASVDNTGDDNWKFYRAGRGNGNLPDNEVFCVAKDKDGFIWIGTAKGIAVIQCPQEVFTAQGCEAFLPIVQQDQFAGFLFQNEEVRSIAIDGANRKWVATRNGVWLISADAEKTIFRFTEDNSPLLSNDVKRITIDPATGEIFFATFKGICSFRSTATEGGETNSEVLVFPNPVPVGYKGTIAIKGLVNNAIVKITELNGRLVYQTRALGGQAVWNGKDYRGNAAAMGVYLVIVSDDTRKEKVVTKVVVGGR